MTALAKKMIKIVLLINSQLMNVNTASLLINVSPASRLIIVSPASLLINVSPASRLINVNPASRIINVNPASRLINVSPAHESTDVIILDLDQQRVGACSGSRSEARGWSFGGGKASQA